MSPMREIIFTDNCTGALGIALRTEGGATQVVAQFFPKYGQDGSRSYNLYDLVVGGAPSNYLEQTTVLNAMLKIAERERLPQHDCPNSVMQEVSVNYAGDYKPSKDSGIFICRVCRHVIMTTTEESAARIRSRIRLD